MGEQIIGRKILRYEQVESTNTLAREFAEQGQAEGLVIAAQEQTAGRGRMGRKWIVPRGTSLQFSVLLRPPLAPQYAPRLSFMAALSVANALARQFNLKAVLKWPNDVLLHEKKVCGILTESSVQGEQLAYAILGVGLNVNYTMSAFPELARFATTVQDVLGEAVDRSSLERTILDELDGYYARIRRGESFLGEYRARLGMLGKRIRVAGNQEILEGIAKDVDKEGALILQTGHKQVKLFAGDVTILKA